MIYYKKQSRFKRIAIGFAKTIICARIKACNKNVSFVHRKGSNGSGSEAATDRGAKSRRESSPTVIEDLLFSAREKSDLFPYNILLVLSVYKEEFPWLYEAGNDFAKTVNSKCSKQARTEAIGKLEKIIECTYELPVYKEMTPMKKECMMLLRELPRICYDMIERLS